jgi:hypothetical protein
MLWQKHRKRRRRIVALDGPLIALLTLCSWALLERSLIVRKLDSFLSFYGTRKFITEFTRALHLSLSWATPIQSTSPHPTSTRSTLILSNHLRLVFLVDFFTLAFQSTTYTRSSCPPFVLHSPSHLILLDFFILTILGEEYKSWSSSLCSLFHSPVSSSVFGPIIMWNKNI